MAHALGMRGGTWLSKPLDFDLPRGALALDSNAGPGGVKRAQSLIKPDVAHVKLALQQREFYLLFNRSANLER